MPRLYFAWIFLMMMVIAESAGQRSLHRTMARIQGTFCERHNR